MFCMRVSLCIVVCIMRNYYSDVCVMCSFLMCGYVIVYFGSKDDNSGPVLLLTV